MRFPALAIMIALAILMAGAFNQALAQDSAQLEEGARLYAENCAVCHGEDGEGRVGATLSKDWPSIRPDLRVRASIENGIEGSPMPPWLQANGGPLTSEQIDAVVAYILSWETGGARIIPPTPTYIPRPVLTTPPEVEGDPNHGAIVFDKNCAVCHGANGEGRVGATLAKFWPSIRADLSIQRTITNGVEGSPMPAWSQANGGPLTETEINDVTAFVMTLKPLEGESQVEPEPETSPGPISGWFSILLTIVVLVLVVWLAIALQARGQSGDH
jgi:mono/diheme cytochrome c family protein